MAKRIVKGAGLALLALLAGAVLLAALPLPRTAPRFATPRLIGPVAIVDVEAGSVRPGQAIVLAGGRIERIVPVAALAAAERRAMVDGGGAFVMPALWDMHALFTRYAPALEHPLSLAHGVTRTRNILDCPGGGFNLHPCRADKRRWNRAVAAGTLLGPVIMGSGSYPVAGPGQRHRDSPAFAAAATAADARALVRAVPASRRGRDHIKTYDGLPRESFFALADEARRRGVELSGHVPAAVATAEAAAAGLKAIAHARALPIGCSSREAEIMRLRAAGAPSVRWMRLALASHDPARCAALWATLRRHGTFVSPTLVTRYNETAAGIADLSSDPAARAATPGLIRLIWREDVAAVEARSAADEAVYRAFYRAAAARTADAAAAGVRLLVGTDTGDIFVAPGIGLHREMALWRAAGIPTRRILAAATVDAAAYFGLSGRIGRVAPGEVADLLFLDADPLADLAALRRPRAVMQAGRLYDRATLDRAVAGAEAAAASWRYPVHFLRDLLRNPLGFAG